MLVRSLTLATSTKPARVTSAVHGALPFTFENGTVTVTLPKLGYGDVLRLDAN